MFVRVGMVGGGGGNSATATATATTLGLIIPIDISVVLGTSSCLPIPRRRFCAMQDLVRRSIAHFRASTVVSIGDCQQPRG